MKFNVKHRKPSRRFGRFSLDTWHVEHRAAAVQRVMSQCIIVRAEMNYMRGAIEYEAISWRFREVEQGFVIPEYLWIWDEETGELQVQEAEPCKTKS